MWSERRVILGELVPTKELSLTTAEKTRLAELEELIERGKKTFLEVGMALLSIREEKLYRPLTFEKYCKERWGFNSQRARQLMSAVETSTRVPISLPTEGHYRALNRVPDHEKAKIAPLIADKTVREAEELVREFRETNGIGKTHNRHPRVIALSEEIGKLADRWSPDMCNELTPPQAKKQLRAIDKAMALLEQVREAVDYRAQTMHTWNGR